MTTRWPVPTVEAPIIDELIEDDFVFDGVAETSDGCIVEPDGICEHGHPSWLRRLGG